MSVMTNVLLHSPKGSPIFTVSSCQSRKGLPKSRDAFRTVPRSPLKFTERHIETI